MRMKLTLRRLFLTAALLPTSFIVNASYSIDWMKMPDILSNLGTSIARDDSDNVYTTTLDGGKIYLEKRDRFGNFQWQAISFTTLGTNHEYPVKVFTDRSGNPVVIGYRYTSSSDGHNANAIIVLKYDHAGNRLFKIYID